MKFLFAAVLCALTWAMCYGHGFWTRPILADDQLYFYMTERCASGVPPHVAQMEVKTQLPTIIGGAALAVGRVFGVSDVIAGRSACVAAAAISVILIWLLSAELAGFDPRQSSGRGSLFSGAVLVGAFGTFVLYGVFLESATGFQPKMYMVVFLLAAHLACARRRPFACGVLGMCAFLCWQPAALVLAACGLATLVDRHSTWKSVAMLIAGAFLALGAYEAWFALHGALEAQIHQELLAFGSSHKPIDWHESLWFFVTESRGFEHYPHPLPAAFLVAGAITLLAAIVRPARAFAIIRERPGLVAFWIGAALATTFTFIDHQAHPDMLLAQPYFPVAAAIASGWIFSWLRGNPGGTTAIAVLTAAFAAWVASEARTDVARAVFNRSNDLESQYAQARLVNLYYDHRGSVWGLGAVHLIGFNHRDNWTPVGNFGRETVELDTRTWRPLRNEKMPEIILAGRGLRPGFQTWLMTEYIDITPAMLARDRIRVFSRRSGVGSGFDKGSAPKAAAGPERKPPPKPAPGAARGPGSVTNAGIGATPAAGTNAARGANAVSGANPARGAGPAAGAARGIGQPPAGAARGNMPAPAARAPAAGRSANAPSGRNAP